MTDNINPPDGWPSLPVFPDIECDGECGFIRAGIGWQCREGQACSYYVHPGDEDYEAVTAYYEAAGKVGGQ